jgi:hypothetical protein
MKMKNSDMYFHHVLVVALGSSLVSGDTPFRRLIVPGPTVEINKHPYSAALLTCKEGTGGSMLCAQFCSGSLIAPDVVLTAGHCTHSSSSPFGNSQPPVELTTIYVLLGTDSPRQSNSQQQLIKVSSLANEGYSLNVRYSIDGDVGLAFLSTCATIKPGFIETIKMATLDREPFPSSSSCVKVSAVGFGRITNLPSPIAVSDGRLRALDDVAHTFDVCLSSYIKFSLQLQGHDPSILDSPGNAEIKHFFETFIVPEYTSCHGGNSRYSTCSGDSGGPIVAEDINEPEVVIGVTSFGVGEFCGYGPDYMTRLAPSAWFIAAKLEQFSLKCRPISESFLTWPVREMTSSERSQAFQNSRCSDKNQWQCGSGECLSMSQVCDRKVDCSDSSDEVSSFCSSAYAKASNVRFGALSDDRTQQQKDTSAELDELIAKNQKWIDQAVNSRRLNDGTGNSQTSVIVVGTLSTSMGPPNTLLLPSVITSLLPPAAQRSENIPLSITDPTTNVRADVPQSCNNTDKTLTDMLATETATGANRAEQDPSALITACGNYVYCSNAGNVTKNTTLGTFCTKFDYFVGNRTLAYSLSDSFNTDMGLTCTIANASPPSVTEGARPTTTTVPPKDGGSNGVTTAEPATVSVATSTTTPVETNCIPGISCKAAKIAAGLPGYTLLVLFTLLAFGTN